MYIGGMKYLAALLTVLACSCSSGNGGGSAPPANPGPIDLDGTWTGTWASSAAAASGDITMSMAYSAPVGIGTGRIDGSPCFQVFNDVQATANDTTRTVSGLMRPAVADNSVRVNFQLTVSADGRSMQGTYSVTAATTACHLDFGSVTLTKTSPAVVRTTRVLAFDASGDRVVDLTIRLRAASTRRGMPAHTPRPSRPSASPRQYSRRP